MQADRQIGRQKDKHADRQIDMQIDRQTGRQTCTQTDWQTDKQLEAHPVGFELVYFNSPMRFHCFHMARHSPYENIFIVLFECVIACCVLKHLSVVS